MTWRTVPSPGPLAWPTRSIAASAPTSCRCKLPPDTRVSVDSLARELGVSQTPIREALSMLEANGLVSKRHFAGYATSPRMDRAQLDELFEFRLLIEPHAARKAAQDDDATATWGSWPAARARRRTTPSPTWIPNSTA